MQTAILLYTQSCNNFQTCNHISVQQHVPLKDSIYSFLRAQSNLHIQDINILIKLFLSSSAKKKKKDTKKKKEQEHCLFMLTSHYTAYSIYRMPLQRLHLIIACQHMECKDTLHPLPQFSFLQLFCFPAGHCPALAGH